MRNKEIICAILLIGTTAATQNQQVYRLGTVREVTPVRFEPTDARPMLCKVRVESASSEITFVTETPQTTTKVSCDKEYETGKEIQFRTMQQDVFVKNPQGKELKGLLVQPGRARTPD